MQVFQRHVIMSLHRSLCENNRTHPHHPSQGNLKPKPKPKTSILSFPLAYLSPPQVIEGRLLKKHLKKAPKPKKNDREGSPPVARPAAGGVGAPHAKPN